MIIERVIIYALGAALAAAVVFGGVTKWQLNSARGALATAEANLIIAQTNNITLEAAIADTNAKTEALKKAGEAANEEARRLLAAARAENKVLRDRVSGLQGATRPEGTSACKFAEQLINDEIVRGASQ